MQRDEEKTKEGRAERCVTVGKVVRTISMDMMTAGMVLECGTSYCRHMKPLIVPKIMTKTSPDQTRYDLVWLLVVGLLFHLIYIGSVFDCYFTSPVVHGMRSYGSGESVAASKRLVLIVGTFLSPRYTIQ